MGIQVIWDSIGIALHINIANDGSKYPLLPDHAVPKTVELFCTVHYILAWMIRLGEEMLTVLEVTAHIFANHHA